MTEPSPDRLPPGHRVSAAALLIAAVSLGLAGCAYQGGDLANPIDRKFSWFSYVAASDLREACVPGAAERYRFVYNGRYLQQVRTYDLTVGPDGSGLLAVQVAGRPDMTTIRNLDLLGPGRGTTGQAQLVPADVERLRRTLADSGFEEPAPAGRRLHSESFYWLAAGCRDGAFRFNAWEWPSPGFDALRFPERLFVHDPTGIPVNPPRVVDDGPVGDDRRNAVLFDLTVTENGLMEALTLF